MQTNVQESAVQNALEQFSFDINELDDITKFNRDLLDRRYKILAKMSHPDRPRGDKKMFLKLQDNYNMLKKLLACGADWQKSKQMQRILGL